MTKRVLFQSKRLLVIETGGWQHVERIKGKEAVAVLAVTADQKLILTEQFRPPVDARVIDLPAGLVGDEDEQLGAAATARKELEEETGYTCDAVERLAFGPTSPGITSEKVTLFRARGVRRVGEGGGVGGESITVHAVPVAGLQDWFLAREQDGLLIDLKIWSGLYFLWAGSQSGR
jgi:ADP-ribose pyrophosphatase